MLASKLRPAIVVLLAAVALGGCLLARALTRTDPPIDLRAEDHAPKQLDLFADHEPLACIYELTDATLRLACRSGGPRPTAFDADGAVLIAFARHIPAGHANPPAATDGPERTAAAPGHA